MRILWVVIVALLLSACGNVQVKDYAGYSPAFDAEEFFNGKLLAHGVVKNRKGLVIRYFSAEIDASWEAGVGTLDERFLFDDGEEQTRVWTLKPDGENRYQATAGDVVGPGTAETAGNSLFLDYVLRIAYKDSTIDLRIDDRMYRVSDTVVINESVMTKFGFRVGSILLVIEKQ